MIALHQHEITTQDGVSVRLVYDPEADILEVCFGENEPATGIELTDDILLRLNRQDHRAVSLTFLHFSILSETTEYGPRSYPLNHLDELEETLQEIVLHVVTTVPVSYFLKLSFFQASPTERVPFAYVQSQPTMAVA